MSTVIGSEKSPSRGDVVVEQLAPSSSLDRVIFGVEDVYDLPPAEVADSQVEWFRAAIDFHTERCDEYRRFAERRRFTVERIQSVADLATIPQYPTTVFKLRPPHTKTDEPVVTFHSSGTTGRHSVVHRDRTTLLRLAGSMQSALTLLRTYVGAADPAGELGDEWVAVNLGPSRRDAAGIWFAYAVALIEAIVPTQHLFDGVRVRSDVCGEVVRDNLAQGRRVAVFGPPALLLDAARTIDEAGSVRGGADVIVVSAGGWKRAGGTAVDRAALTDLLVGAFGLVSADQVRDGFSQVELNSVVLECEAHRKHLPPWLVAIPRDPQTMRPVPVGRPGLLTFLDASPTSFPCFVVGDDIGSIDDGGCPCGRASPTITVVRRLERSTKEGCAVKIDQLGVPGADHRTGGGRWTRTG